MGTIPPFVFAAVIGLGAGSSVLILLILAGHVREAIRLHDLRAEVARLRVQRDAARSARRPEESRARGA